MDGPALLAAARFEAARSVSLADALIAAYGMRADAVPLHKDSEYAALSAEVRLEALPYKQG